MMGKPVCPLSAGSWALENELRVIRLNPDLLNVGRIVIVSNSGDFGAPSVWRSEYTHPTHRPFSALIYAASKKLWPVNEAVDSSQSAAATQQWQASWRDLLARYRGQIVLVVYPKKDELAHSSAAFDQLLSLAAKRVEVIDVARDPSWSAGDYRDSIHPTAVGDRALAAIIARGVLKTDLTAATNQGGNRN